MSDSRPVASVRTPVPVPTHARGGPAAGHAAPPARGGARTNHGRASARGQTNRPGGLAAAPVPAARGLRGNGRKAHQEVTVYG